MLKIWTYQSRRQIEEQLLKLDFEANTWILSDLRSKLEIQNRLFEKLGFSLDDYVMRASDLWGALLRKSEPHFEVISYDYALLLTRHFLNQISGQMDEQKNEAFRGLSEKIWLEQLSRWGMTVFSKALRVEVSQYLEQNPSCKNTWGREFIFAGLLADFFLNQKKLTAKWIPAFLQSQVGLHEIWERPLWIDLRGELSQSEAELLQALSRSHDVNVLMPSSDFENEYFDIHKPYEYLFANAQVKQELPKTSLKIPSPVAAQVVSFSGPLAEVKWAVGQVRQWLDAGIPLEQIALVAPDIEDYWPCLQSYLEIEGIPTQKPAVSRLSSFSSVRRWLARIRSTLNPLDYFSHEKAHFGSEEQTEARFEEFRSFLFEIYEPGDLVRMQSVFSFIKAQPKWPELISRDEFIARCMQLWPERKTEFSELLTTAIEKFLREAQIQTVVRPSDWLSFFESILTQTEIVLSEKSSHGVVVTSLMSAWSQQLKKVIFLGLAEESLTSYSRLGLSPVDSQMLSRDLGIVIESMEQNFREYEMRWWLASPEAEIYLLEPATNWSGQLLNHSSLFLSFVKNRPSELKSWSARWDQIQARNLEQIIGSENKLHRIYEDQGKKQLPLIALPQASHLSPSVIENYLKCHFIYLAQKEFKLMDPADVDIDIDRRKGGQFQHALVEALIKKSVDFQMPETEILQILEALRQEHLHIRSDDSTWIPRRTQFLKWSQHFLTRESDWKKQFPESQILALESPWSVQFQFKENKITFRGRIDRVDGNRERQEWMVLDYKSSAAGMPAVKSWIEKGKLQLLFYLWAIECGVLPEIQGKALGAFYYDLRTLNREKGLRLDVETTLLPAIKRKNSAIDIEKYQLLMASFQEVMEDILINLSAGDFKPEPRDESDCPTCTWKKICRAPHLNQN